MHGPRPRQQEDPDWHGATRTLELELANGQANLRSNWSRDMRTVRLSVAAVPGHRAGGHGQTELQRGFGRFYPASCAARSSRPWFLKPGEDSRHRPICGRGWPGGIEVPAGQRLGALEWKLGRTVR